MYRSFEWPGRYRRVFPDGVSRVIESHLRCEVYRPVFSVRCCVSIGLIIASNYITAFSIVSFGARTMAVYHSGSTTEEPHE